jgi:hypothetical protein
MEKIRNKATGIVYEITSEELKNMRRGEIFASTFDVITVKKPPEVVALEKRMTEESSQPVIEPTAVPDKKSGRKKKS